MIKINGLLGYSFEKIAKEAHTKAWELNDIIAFDFNGIECRVGTETNLNYLWRDYSNAHMMGWETVGHVCVKEYDVQTQKELEQKELESKIRAEQERIVYEAEEILKKESLSKKINDETLLVKDEEGLKKWKDKNTDPYGIGIIKYAELWGCLMQVEMKSGKQLVDIAGRTSHEADIDGITGFMYGAAVHVLSDVWEYGEQLRKWHNKEYGHEGDGIVNPAILTIDNLGKN